MASRFRLGKFGCVGAAVIGLYFVQVACQELADLIRYTKPITLTYDQFVQKPPSSGVFNITGGLLVVPHGERVSMTGVTSTLYIPLRRPTDNADSPIKILVHPADPRVTATYEALVAQDAASDGERRRFYASNMNALVSRHDVVGTVSHGLDYANLERIDLLREDERLDPHVEFVDEGRRPSFWRLAWNLAVGVLMLAIVLREMLGRKPTPPAVNEQQT